MRNVAPLILIVEDDLLVRMVAAAALEDAGYSVLEAECALEALEVLARGAGVSILFSDINMAGMNGLQLARVASERHPGLTVLLTSGYEQPSAEEIPPGGRFLPKPYLPEQMIAVVSTLAA